MTKRHISIKRTPRLTTHGSFSSLLLVASLGACSSEAVRMGEVDPDAVGGTSSQSLPASSRCHESTTIQGDVWIDNQAQLDALEGCEVIEGHLTIGGFHDADLRPLHALTTVRGSILIDMAVAPEAPNVETPMLDSLEGLESLQSAASLDLRGLLADNVDALSNLAMLTTGRLWILASPNLRALDGLANLRAVTDLVLACPALEDIAPLQLADAMTGLNIYAARFSRLSPLGVGIVSGGPLEISNTELRNLDAFAGLVYAPGNIRIGDNPLLENIDGLKDLQFAGPLSISHNPSLAHLPPFSTLKTLSALEVSDNDSLVEIPAFSFSGAGAGGQDPLSLLSRSSALAVITDNAALSSITLPEMWLGGSALIIDNNPALEQVNLTQQLSYDYLSITGNPALASVDIGVLGTVDLLEVLDNPELDTSVFGSVQTFETRMSSNGVAP
jgi:hypothetical protein